MVYVDDLRSLAGELDSGDLTASRDAMITWRLDAPSDHVAPLIVPEP